MEFGSDFHKIEYPVGKGMPYGVFNHYASGRQPLLDVISFQGYKRVWVPSYYCGESLNILSRVDVEIKRYNCLPTDRSSDCITNLPLDPKDLLLLVNFFGLHGLLNSQQFPCDVIEDHTHDLIGEWALNSNARWAFASIRKTLPTADGGILWSPINSSLPKQHTRSNDVAGTIAYRYSAMDAKADYLQGKSVDKDIFLRNFKATEDRFGEFSLSDWSAITDQTISAFDIEGWYKQKRTNYRKLLSLLEFHNANPIIGKSEHSTPFSLIILFKNNAQRDKARSYLIRNNVYPAILWPDVYASDEAALDLSKCLLSIHCDGRYFENDMKELAKILNHVI